MTQGRHIASHIYSRRYDDVHAYVGVGHDGDLCEHIGEGDDSNQGAFSGPMPWTGQRQRLALLAHRLRPRKNICPRNHSDHGLQSTPFVSSLLYTVLFSAQLRPRIVTCLRSSPCRVWAVVNPASKGPTKKDRDAPRCLFWRHPACARLCGPRRGPGVKPGVYTPDPLSALLGRTHITATP